MKLKVKEFQHSDNEIYSSWFENPDMERFMGPAWSEDELDQISNENDGVVLSVFSSNNLVGVVSLAFPNKENSNYGITGISIAPHMQRQGVGGKVLEALREHFNTSSWQLWSAFVSTQNINAQKFMLKYGWRQTGEESEMYKFTYKQ